MITIKNLDKHFNKHKSNRIHVINDISIDFPEKGLVVLLGPSGSGKTTLLNVIGGLDKVDKGEIDILNHKISKYRARVWDKLRTEEIGYIFQNYYLMNQISVFDNVAFVLKMMGIHDEEEIKTRVEYILKQVGMFRFRKKKASQLSGGQQQRVAIARALVKNPKIIIADEPTGNLDSKNTLEIMNIIKSISINKLVVLVTHEKELAEFYGDRIIELKDGKVIDDRLNDHALSHNYGQESVIYLKDLNQTIKLNNNGVNIEVYKDDEYPDMDVKLILKNGTIYIKVDSKLQKLRLIDQNSNVEIKNEHYKKKTRDELLETSFDESILDHSKLERKRGLSISFMTSFWIAFRRFLSFGRKGKLMLTIFLISGALITISVINIYSIYQRTIDNYISRDQNYIVVYKNATTTTDINKLIEDVDDITNGDYIFKAVNYPFTASIYLGANKTLSIETKPSLEFIEQLSDSDVIHGNKPTKKLQIVVSRGLIEQKNIQVDNFQQIGIWSYHDIIGEKMINSYFAPVEDLNIFEVVGVTYHTYPAIYFYNYEGLLTFVESVPSINNIDEYNFSTLNNNNNEVLLYTKLDPNHVIEQLRIKNYHVDLSSREAYKQLENEKNKSFVTTITSVGIFVAGALLSFYFVMRSSMISRIYEVAVYRALGVRKIDLIASFSVEVLLLTTVSSFVGLVVTHFIFGLLTSTPLSGLVDMKADYITFMISLVLVYGSNLIIGTLPMSMLLRKTPAQIISTYDM